MIVYVANPLYDAVFKYLMEDERIAKTILSALLKKKVLEVNIRRNEYANITRNEAISMFRIDFAAKVMDENGKSSLMLIELQKTWLPTETLRFRRYLALQYNNEENMVKEQQGKYAVPMVAIYLLGHRVGKIDAPILYVNHKAYDYDNNEVSVGIPDPFVESLQHNSIIVQIPLLHGHVNNRLEQILCVFDQANVIKDDKRILQLDDCQFQGDYEMEYMVRRLQSAAADPNLRYQMNAEDEFFKELENRDTAIMQRDKIIEEKDAQINEKDAQINEKDAQINEKDAQINEKDAQINEKDAQINEKDAQINEKDALLKEQSDMLRIMVKNLQETGMSIEAIAKLLNKSETDIKSFLQSESKH